MANIPTGGSNNPSWQKAHLGHAPSAADQPLTPQLHAGPDPLLQQAPLETRVEGELGWIATRPIRKKCVDRPPAGPRNTPPPPAGGCYGKH